MGRRIRRSVRRIARRRLGVPRRRRARHRRPARLAPRPAAPPRRLRCRPRSPSRRSRRSARSRRSCAELDGSRHRRVDLGHARPRPPPQRRAARRRVRARRGIRGVIAVGVNCCAPEVVLDAVGDRPFGDRQGRRRLSEQRRDLGCRPTAPGTAPAGFDAALVRTGAPPARASSADAAAPGPPRSPRSPSALRAA